ncbi:MAG: hypothetical protein R3F10_01620 [Lysobacteraceae bacterium]
MQFNVLLTQPNIDVEAIGQLLQQMDPSGMVDVDRLNQRLRISTHVSGAELIDLMAKAGTPIRANQIEQVPSVCCGGCGG